jgi:hypothetical protein
MQKGRNYRRVNPPLLTADGRETGWPPYFFRAGCGFHYFGLLQLPGILFFDNGPIIRLDLGRVTWVKQFGLGVQVFTCTVTQQLLTEEPGFAMRVEITDAGGGFSRIDWKVVEIGWWNEDVRFWLDLDDPVFQTGGLFGIINFFNVACTIYADEP